MLLQCHDFLWVFLIRITVLIVFHCFFLQVFHTLDELYKGDINSIDVWVGGLLETRKSGPGELFATIIEDQFRRIRDGDRFWFENIENKYVTMIHKLLIMYPV